MKKTTLLILLLSGFWLYAQQFTRKDSLQGGLRPERTAFDVQRYDLNILINPSEKFITGYSDVSFKVLETTQRIQLDLFENMQVDSIVFNKQKLKAPAFGIR